MSDLISAGVGPFGNAQDPTIVPCAVCGDPVEHLDKFMVEKEIIHKACFICAFCDAKLQVGYCVQELALYNRYGPCWYCSLICAHRPLAEKEAKLKANGVEVRQPSTRRPKGSSGINVLPAGAVPPAGAQQQQQQPEPPANEQPDAAAEPVTETAAGDTNAVSGEDGPEMEAEEVVAAGREEAPKGDEPVGTITEGNDTGAENRASEAMAGLEEGGDGPEMEAEEVVKGPQTGEPTAATEQPMEGNEPTAGDESGTGEMASAQASEEISGAGATESPTGDDEPNRKISSTKPVAMDAYENKYRLQMQKKKK